MKLFPKVYGNFKNSEKKDTISGKTIYVVIDYFSYIEYDSASRELKSFSRAINNPAVCGYDYTLNPIIGIYKQFYADGRIREKGLSCVFGFKIGKWYSFNKKGQHTKIENFDKGYAFGYREVLDYCQGKQVPMDKAHDGRMTGIWKINGRYVIRYLKRGTNILRTITLNGMTGNEEKVSEEIYALQE